MYLSRIVKRFVYLMEQRSVKAASKIIVVSEPMKQFLISEWNISPNKIEIIPNGFHKSQVERLNVTTTAQVEGLVCFMGIMHPYIDLRKIIEIGKKLEHAQVEIIGDGLLSKNLRYLISRHQLNNISISGFLPYEEALSHVCRAQVAIAPYIDSLSLRVSCPVKLYDYGALGKAIVADDATEIGRRFHASRAAIVSDPSETDRFVQNVDLLLDDKQMRNE
jgi:glycosyltransferase involved in cell wall biosynthesis